MKHWIGEIIGVRLRDLPGARLSGSCPFSDTLVNRLCAERLPAQSAVAAVVVEFHDGDLFTARVRLRAALIPPLTVEVRIEQQPDPARSVPLVLHWSIGAIGRAAPMAALLLRRFAGLPSWIEVQADTLAVDVGGLIDARGYGEIVPYVTGVNVSTSAGRLVVDFDLQAPPVSP